MTTKEPVDKDELVATLLCDYVQRFLPKDFKARLAVERYMRTYLRSLTRFELEFEVQWAEDNGRISEMVRTVTINAIEGYDRFMAKRQKREKVAA